MAGGPGTSDPGQINYSNVTLADIVLEAYGIQPYQLKGGPSWLDSERFNVTAKVPQGASKEDCKVMLQGLLADRFKLAVHRESQEGRNYELVVDKGGPKLKTPTNGAGPRDATIGVDDSGSPQVAANALGRPVALAGKHMMVMMAAGQVVIMANSQPVSALAGRLTRMMDGPVRDSTGLTGNYDFTLDFAPPPGMRVLQMGTPGEFPSGTGEPPLSVFQALRERLGLRLDVKRGPIDVFIVDHVERVPTAN